MADTEGAFGSSESLENSNHNGLNNAYRPTLSHLQNIHSPTLHSSSSVEPALIVDSRETISESDSLVSTIKVLTPPKKRNINENFAI
jgi:hypothetical protein